MVDLLLTGGMVIDPASGLHTVADVAIADGKVAALGANLAEPARERLDCRGAFVTPGLIDLHTHIFHLFTTLGAPVAEACFRRGVTAAADAGSAGCWTFPAFRRYVVEAAPIPVYCFLNVSALGILDFNVGELRRPDYLDQDAAVATAQAHADVIKGFKVRLGEHMTGGSFLPALRGARVIGERTGLPLLVHIGGTAEPLPAALALLRPGDIVSHCYTGQRHGILADGRVLPEVQAAREAGVLFDAAHGAGNLSFAVARHAIDAGFVPDIISSDNSLRNWRGPVYDLVTTMSKFLALGLSIDQVVERTTLRPAQLLGITETGAGRIAAGDPANLTILRLIDVPCTLHDAAGETLHAPRLESLYTVLNGVLHPCAPWRGAG